MYQTQLTEETLQKLKEIERAAYDNPEYMEFQDCENWNDVADYLECELEAIHLYITDNYYFVCAEHKEEVELVDFASIGKRANIKQVLQFMEQFSKTITMDCRQSTSYPIICALEKMEKVVLENDEPWEWEGETFHSIRLWTTKALEREMPQEELEKADEREL